MDGWTYPDPNRDVDSPLSQLTLLESVGREVEDRFPTARAKDAAQGDDRRAADLEQSRGDSVHDGRNAFDLPLPFATPPGAAFTV